MVENSNEKSEKNEGGLIGILRVLWKRRVLIVLGTGLITLAAVVTALLLPKEYMSKAVVSLSTIKKADQEEPPSGMDIPVYTKFSTIFRSQGLFKLYIREKENTEKWDIDDDFFDTHFQTIYAFEYGRPGIKTTENSILGMEIEVLGSTPEAARNKARLMAEYIITTLLNMQVGNFLDVLSIRTQSGIVQMERAVIDQGIEIRFLKEKESLIENQLLKIPGIGNKTDRELVTANENTEKYLSPQQQLVAVKMSMKDSQIQIDRYIRKIKVNRFLLDFLDKMSPLFRGDREHLVNDGLLAALMKERENFFAGKEDEESKLASYTLSEQFYYFRKLQNTIYKIISGPTLPEKHYKPKRKRIVIATFFLAFFFFLFLALLVEQWEQTKK